MKEALFSTEELEPQGIKKASLISSNAEAPQPFVKETLRDLKIHKPLSLVKGSASHLPKKDPRIRPQAKGKFLWLGDEKLWVKGVTYGTFRPDETGNEFQYPQRIQQDFTKISGTSGSDMMPP